MAGENARSKRGNGAWSAEAGPSVPAMAGQSPGVAQPESARPLDYAAFQASLKLELEAPGLSARAARLPRPSGPVAAWLGLASCAGLLQPGLAVIALAWLGLAVFTLLVAWRAALLWVATMPGFARSLPAEIPEGVGLPVYSILVPLFREAAAIPGLARALGALDWPPGRLEIILLLETGDEATKAAVEAADWPAGTRQLIAPPGLPQTKPRALNYGLQYAQGALVCIYDAEDRPHPSQLRQAYGAFLRRGPSVACVQAPLAAYNHRGSWLALHWGLEYAVQFGLLLPALARLRLPLLLGGTSNHFRMSVLRRLHGWDAWNVTEDADLGVRLARRGFKSAVIGAPTFEEAPETLRIWVAQRSRWLKGFLQTWAVMCRNPRQTARETGLFAFIALQIMVLGPVLAALAHAPICIGLAAWWIWGGASPSGMALALALAGYGANVYGVLAAPGPAGLRRWLGAVTLPAYWPLQSVAALRAVYGLLRTPHFWAKTPHGLTAEAR
ncbi:MAG: glycosyltransferase [Pseudomonadota bacterium]